MKTFITLLVIINSLLASAQEKTITTESKKITGVITDSNGMQMPGVNVIIEGTTKSVLTDFDGNYTINAKEGDVLVASYIGMANEIITISKQTSFDFKLREAKLPIKPISAPDTHAIKSVTALWKEKRLSEKFVQMLQEKKPAISIGCIPDLSETIIIRCSSSINGNHEPLYVIDNFLRNADNFNEINPDDIISINVLKDVEATSIYGNRVENGVIIVKTKNGMTKKEKRKLKREKKKLEKEKRESEKLNLSN